MTAESRAAAAPMADAEYAAIADASWEGGSKAWRAAIDDLLAARASHPDLLTARASHPQPEQADDGQATGEPDASLQMALDDLDVMERRLAAVEALASRHRVTYLGEPYHHIPAVDLRAALAANPPTSGSETDRG